MGWTTGGVNADAFFSLSFESSEFCPSPPHPTISRATNRASNIAFMSLS